MDRLHLSALLHRCGHLAETKTSQVPRSLLPDVLQRLAWQRFSPRELASALWSCARLREGAAAREVLREMQDDGPEHRDATFMERLRCLAREALSWPFLTRRQRLVWGAALELEAVPVLITVPSRALLDQFAADFPGFCKVGTDHNDKINFDAKGFIAVTNSVWLLQKLTFDVILVDEAHHPLPVGMPKYKEMYQFSATHTDEPKFRYRMGQAIEDGVLSDYDITVPVISQYHAYICLGDLLLKQAGRFRRVLAYCNTVA
ncbi:unnamed protein product, partial [Durusdinium trenchii]